MDDFSIVADVRGHGLFLGFELISDINNMTPAAHQAKYLKNRMKELGVLISTDGPDENVIKIKPPMCFSHEDANFFLTQLRQALGEDFMK